MTLSPEQLTILFNQYLKTYVLPGSGEHHPIFDSLAGGNALTRRVQKILKDPRLSYLLRGESVDIVTIFEKLEVYLNKYEPLNYSFY